MHLNNVILLNAIPALLVLIIAEALYMMREHRHNNKDMFTSITLGLIGIPLSFVIKGVVLYTYSFVYQFRFFTLHSNMWYTWVICFFADDFSYYWFHRISHKVRFLWASHMVHHSSEQFTLTAGLRVPWTANFTGTFLFWAWMPLLGIEPAMVLFFKSASIAYQFWMHTETIRKLPKWFEAIFNTPSHHRVHHGSDTEYLDKNHAGTLIIWDKMFGTFLEEAHPPTYGLTENINSFNPLVIEFHEWKKLVKDVKQTNSVKHKLLHIFGTPGWRPGSSSKTTKLFRKRLQAQE